MRFPMFFFFIINGCIFLPNDGKFCNHKEYLGNSLLVQITNHPLFLEFIEFHGKELWNVLNYVAHLSYIG